jgi:hypothetical protein
MGRKTRRTRDINKGQTSPNQKASLSFIFGRTTHTFTVLPVIKYTCTSTEHTLSPLIICRLLCYIVIPPALTIHHYTYQPPFTPCICYHGIQSTRIDVEASRPEPGTEGPCPRVVVCCYISSQETVCYYV